MSLLKTPLTEQLEIEVPLLCGAMYPCSNPELVAAASEAGALGVIQPLSLVYVHGHEFRAGLRLIRSLTSKPVGMNVIVEKSSKVYQERMQKYVDLALEEGIRFFVTSLGNPRWVADKAHAVGGRVYHDVTDRRWALKGLEAGVDGLIAVNNRAGGHAGPQSAEALYEELHDLGVPLVCAGGVGDEAAFVRALRLGYDGVQMGTRFIATAECTAPAEYKQAILDADEDDVVLTERLTGVPVSVIRTPYIEKMGTKAGPIGRWMLQGRKTKHWMRMIYSLRSLWSLKKSVRGSFSYKDYLQAGKSVAGIHEVEPVAEIVRRFRAAGEGEEGEGPQRPPLLQIFLLALVSWLIVSSVHATDLFLDRAADWGLTFSYWNGMTGQYYYPEIIGGGAALFDYDNDGDLDVFLPQGAPLGTGKPTLPPPAQPGGRLFRNDLISKGSRKDVPRFVDVTEASGIRSLVYGTGAATGDVDNDGDLDLYVLAFGANQLWKNRGDGTFEDASKAAGVDDPRFSLSASFADLDRDGWLDLYVANYVDFAVEQNLTCYAPSSRRDYCGPSAFPAALDRLYRNRGNGTFEDVSLPSGIASKAGRGMGVVAVDLDGDGWQDLFVANDGMFNFLWRNHEGKRFEEIGLLAGAAVNADGETEANMGIAAGDFDSDGDDDLFVTHMAGETNTLWVNDGTGSFEDRTNAARLGAPSLPSTGFGTAWIDYDNDGWLDLLAANGAVTEVEERVRAGDAYPYAQTHQLFRNLGDGKFADVSREAGAPFQQREIGRGAAFGDVDNDGDTDVLIVNTNGPARLLINQVGNRRPWLGLRLMDAKRDLLGARVAVLRKGGPPLWRRAATDGSYAAANDPRILVGLGDAAEVTEIRVLWPDGKSEVFPPAPLRTYTTLIQGTGKPLVPEVVLKKTEKTS